jgi:hypothetical protein
VCGCLPTSQAAVSLQLGDVLHSVDGVTIQRWKNEDFARVGAALRLHPRVGGDVSLALRCRDGVLCRSVSAPLQSASAARDRR